MPSAIARCLGLLTLLLAAAAPAIAATPAPEPWRVVVLHGADLTQPSALIQNRAFRAALEAAAPNGVQFYTEALDQPRFNVDLAPEFLALLAKKYQGQGVDLVVTVSDFALTFAEKNHAQLWPGAPVLVMSIEEQRLRERGLPAQFAASPLRIDVAGTLALAERLQPGARRLVVVAGATNFDRMWAGRAADAARARTSRAWQVEVWAGLPMAELRRRLAALDLGTAVLYGSMSRDGDGRSYFPYEALKPMVEVARAPIYGWYPTYLEHGLAAGSVVSFEDSGRGAAALAISILRGERAAAGTIVPAAPSRCIAHGGRLQALGLDAGVLPPDCTIAFRPPSLWRDYRREVLAGAAVVLLQALTIAALLLQRRLRRRAEDEAARRRAELTRATRIASVGELSASIAHEVGQPLTAILANADAARRMLARGVDEPGELGEILADVRRDALRASEVVRRLRRLLEKHAVAFTAMDLRDAVEETLALLAPEAARRNIVLERRLSAAAAPIRGDRVQVQQVVLNLVLNAMEAMQDTPPGQRIVRVALRPEGEGFELAIADRGHGIPPEAREQLFESFFTTKPNGMGLGLAIVRTVVEAHQGRVRAEPRAEGGTEFLVWFARREGAAVEPVRPEGEGVPST